MKTGWITTLVLTLSGSSALEQQDTEVRDGEKVRIATWNLEWFF